VSFGVISILANTFYTFALAASIISTLSGFNLAVLTVSAFGVIGLLSAWLGGFLQNSLSIALMEGYTRKRNRSLRLTLRKSLRAASRTSSAWLVLLSAALLPAAACLLVGTVIAVTFRSEFTAGAPYFAAIGTLSAAWILWVFANYSLLPYVTLFEGLTSWRESASRSRRLVLHKGRLFIACGLLAMLTILAGLYSLAGLAQNLASINSTALFLMLSVITVSTANAMLTMLYRKRKLARK